MLRISESAGASAGPAEPMASREVMLLLLPRKRQESKTAQRVARKLCKKPTRLGCSNRGTLVVSDGRSWDHTDVMLVLITPPLASNEKRLNKSQSQIGIEDGIPTAAGAGTTLPQDETVQSAFRSGAERHEAKVPQDYEPVDCPTKHAGNKDGKKTVPVGSSSSQSTREQRGQHEDDEEEDGQEQGGKVKGTAQKIKNVVKGDAKIVAGLVTRNEDKKEAGREIKRGAA